MKRISLLILISTFIGCKPIIKQDLETDYLKFSENILDYKVTPNNKFDKSGLMFSDQGAWFAYSLPKEKSESIGFTGPFLMTQQNGVWLTTSFTGLIIKENDEPVDFKTNKSASYTSHLEQHFSNKNITVEQKLVFKNGHSSFLKTTIKNISKNNVDLQLIWKNSPILADGITLSNHKNLIQINSKNSKAKGHLIFSEDNDVQLIDSLQYTVKNKIYLIPNESKEIVISQTFIFPEYSWEKEKSEFNTTSFDNILKQRKQEKNTQLKSLIKNSKPQFQDSIYAKVLAKAHLTLQNNWRIAAGEIKHEGLFPSYHYKWFNGFWSWDSWKHAVGLSYYDTELAKKQIKLMFEFQDEDGFVADCVFRDTLIEKHNYRDTKPPLSAWAVIKVHEKNQDLNFLNEMYPKLLKYHNWWYIKRDHDQDGLCEYGSTDGSLVAAKWESGMDNAIRFDNSKILKNPNGAYSLNQESVDLNAYLYAEKLYLAQISNLIHKNADTEKLTNEATILKQKIQLQFYDEINGWFYDTSLDGKQFIRGEGSEGWTALWAKAATQNQAEKIKIKMLDSTKFYTKVPFQTMSADHEKFDPLKGYWRGPNWLDQAYFGIKGLRNYGFNLEADKTTIKILNGAEGILKKGKSIRENYHPLTGEGLHAQNFSWSAAHIIMMLEN